MTRLAKVLLGSTGLSLLAATAMFAGEATGPLRWQTDCRQAHQVRVDAGRPLLVFLTTDGCPFCTKMLQTTYRDRDVATEITANYVPTVINAARNQALAKQFGVRIFPTTVLVDSHNRIVDKIEGYVTAEALLDRLAQANQRLAANNPPAAR